MQWENPDAMIMVKKIIGKSDNGIQIDIVKVTEEDVEVDLN